MRTALILAAALLISSTQARADEFLVWRARADIGKGPIELGLRRTTLWCSAWLDKVTGRDIGDRAEFWALKRPRTKPQVGVIAVLHRGKTGGHVGIVSGFDQRGNPILISGNHNRVVGEGVYPRQRIYAYVLP